MTFFSPIWSHLSPSYVSFHSLKTFLEGFTQNMTPVFGSTSPYSLLPHNIKCFAVFQFLTFTSSLFSVLNKAFQETAVALSRQSVRSKMMLAERRPRQDTARYGIVHPKTDSRKSIHDTSADAMLPASPVLVCFKLSINKELCGRLHWP